MRFRIKKGLDIALSGEPDQAITEAPRVTSVAVLGADYHGVRPSFLVSEGDRVQIGQPLFTDRRYPDVRFTSPGSGVVQAIQRGERRALESVIIALASGEEAEQFPARSRDELPLLEPELVRELLLASGLWTALRTRPYGRVPEPESTPHSLFVTAIDTNPLAARPDVVIDAYRQDFDDGLHVISHLTRGRVFLCQREGARVSGGDSQRITVASFAGTHPAGLVGTHIHLLDPVGPRKTVWYLGYQDVIAIGKLFTTGRLWVERIVALAGPLVRRPRLIRTRLGASTDELVRGELFDGEARVISGSVLSGHRASGTRAYLGRFHTQLCVLAEERRSERLRWAHSLLLPRLLRRRRWTTAMHGRPRTMVPIGTFERVVPLAILPTQLLRALVVGDTDMARALGCLELEEEDLALCALVCPSKNEYGPPLRAALTRIEKEG